MLLATLQEPHLRADAVTMRTPSRRLLALVAQLLPVSEEIAAYDKEITRLFLRHADSPIFQSLPGAGKRLAPRRFSEGGEDRTRSQEAGSLQALAGSSPVLYASGTSAKPHRRYACRKPLRNALHQCAWPSTLPEDWARAYSQRKRAEGKSHSVAVCALSHGWVRIIFALWSKKQCYQTSVFEEAQRLPAPHAT